MQSATIHCPCHENHKCNYRFFCGLCCDLLHKSELQFEPKQNTAYDPEPSLMCNPTDVLISFPFKTKNSIIPSASFCLNKLNLRESQHTIISEDMFMKSLSRHVKHVTKEDLYSLYPHKNINNVIVILWT